MGMNNRIIEFDIIKCLAIFLVLWGHSIQHLSDTGRNNDAFVVISMFHMPLFMLISGFFSRKSIELSFSTLITKKLKQLIYPTISFGFVFLLIGFIVSFFKNHSISSSLISVGSYFYGSFWFLKSVFFCYIIQYCCIKLANNIYIGGGGSNLSQSIYSVI